MELNRSGCCRGSSTPLLNNITYIASAVDITNGHHASNHLWAATTRARTVIVGHLAWVVGIGLFEWSNQFSQIKVKVLVPRTGATALYTELQS
jgi:hypothetical protein